MERLRGEQFAKQMSGTSGFLTAADLLRLGSFLVAITRVTDKIMLIARIVIDDSYQERETVISNLTALDGTERGISLDNQDR